MSRALLAEAHDAVQARKEAAGHPEAHEVIAGEAMPATTDDPTAAHMVVGTDLTIRDVDDAATHAVLVLIPMALRTGMDAAMVAKSAYAEGLLVGVEYGRRLTSRERA